jgi:hypothetical protein
MAKRAHDRTGAGDAQELAVTVAQLTEETRLLRMSLDELRDDVVWAARQVLAAGHEVAPAQVPCKPIDPLAPDADFRQYPVHDGAPGGTSGGREPQRLDDACESVEYCCNAPRLTWNGDPDTPGIACESCGYIVAENGSIVIWRDDSEPEPKPAARAQDRQSQLFE